MEQSYNCTECGECCKHVAGFLDTKPGTDECIFLVDNLCSIYEFRPEICRVDTIYHKYFSGTEYKDFHNYTAEACNTMIRGAGLDDKYLVGEV